MLQRAPDEENEEMGFAKGYVSFECSEHGNRSERCSSASAFHAETVAESCRKRTKRKRGTWVRGWVRGCVRGRSPDCMGGGADWYEIRDTLPPGVENETVLRPTYHLGHFPHVSRRIDDSTAFIWSPTRQHEEHSDEQSGQKRPV